MGGSTEFGGMWPEQASAELFANDAGRPTLPAGDVAFIPLRVQPLPEGHTDEGNTDELLEPPALFKIRRIGPGGRAQLHCLPWRPGLQLKHYLREAGLIGARMRLALNIDGLRRVTMAYVPKLGESLNMVPPQRPLLQLREF